MRVYPGIVPPQPITTTITDFSLTLASTYPNVSAQRASGPHITLKAPQYPDSFEPWLTAATQAIAGLKPFQVSFGAPTFLTRGIFVLTASAQSLNDLNRRLAAALLAYNHPDITNYDFDLYAPHITLAYSRGASQELRTNLYQQAATKLLPLPEFTAREVQIFVRDDHDFEYRLGPRLPLV